MFKEYHIRASQIRDERRFYVDVWERKEVNGISVVVWKELEGLGGEWDEAIEEFWRVCEARVGSMQAKARLNALDEQAKLARREKGIVEEVNKK